MKIICGVRSLNEEELLPVFLANMQWCDEILIADGGSTDRSKEIATADPLVTWLDFPHKVPGVNGGWRNPEGLHMKFLIDACDSLAKPEDWIWLTEVDAFPNLNLQSKVRSVLENLNEQGTPLLMTWLMYLAPDGVSHYPRTMQGPGYTAWKPGMATVNESADFEGQGNLAIPQGNALKLGQEFSRIHLTWESEELIEQKREFYKLVHGWEIKHPDADWGPREPLPEWAKWHDPRRI